MIPAGTAVVDSHCHFVFLFFLGWWCVVVKCVWYIVVDNWVDDVYRVVKDKV